MNIILESIETYSPKFNNPGDVALGVGLLG